MFKDQDLLMLLQKTFPPLKIESITTYDTSNQVKKYGKYFLIFKEYKKVKVKLKLIDKIYVLIMK